MNIYFGNLHFDAHENDLRQMLESYGEVGSISMHEDKFSGRPRRFAFVKMLRDDVVQTVIKALDGTYLKGFPTLAMRVIRADASVKGIVAAS